MNKIHPRVEELETYGRIISNCVLQGNFEEAKLYQMLYKRLQKKIKKMKMSELSDIKNRKIEFPIYMLN